MRPGSALEAFVVDHGRSIVFWCVAAGALVSVMWFAAYFGILQ